MIVVVLVVVIDNFKVLTVRKKVSVVFGDLFIDDFD